MNLPTEKTWQVTTLDGRRFLVTLWADGALEVAEHDGTRWGPGVEATPERAVAS